MTLKEIKAEIRKLKKLKRGCRAGTPERLELGRQIKDLNKQMEPLLVVDKEKDKVIAEILELDSECKAWGVDLYKHSLVDLQYHLKKLKEKK